MSEVDLQALADFAAREGISLEGTAAPAPAARSMGSPQSAKPQSDAQEG